MAGLTVTAAKTVKMQRKKEKRNTRRREILELTWYVSVTILKGVEVVHEFFDGDLEGLEQAGVFKEPVGDLKDKNQNVKSLISFAKLYSFWY